MKKLEAKKIWDDYIEEIADYWKSEYPGESLDADWSEVAYQSIPGGIGDAPNKSWADFHEEVAAKLD